MTPAFLAVVASIAVAHVQPSTTSTTPTQPVVLPAKPAPIEPTSFQAKLEALDARIAKVSDLAADFRQEKSTPLLKKPIVSTGRIRAKGEQVRWDTLEPRRTSMLLTGSEIRLYYYDDKSLEIYPLEGDLRQVSGTPLPRLDWLRENFDLAEISPERVRAMTSEPTDIIGVELTPKSERTREHVATIRVLMDTQVPCLKRLWMVDSDGNSSVVELSNIKINAGLKASDIELEVPADAKVNRPLDPKKPEKEKSPATPTPDVPAGKPAK